jgi:hypothetical protein
VRANAQSGAIWRISANRKFDFQGDCAEYSIVRGANRIRTSGRRVTQTPGTYEWRRVNVVNGVPGAPINVTFTPGSEHQPEIAVNSQGTVYLSWVGDPNDAASSDGNVIGPIKFASLPNCAAVQQ